MEIYIALLSFTSAIFGVLVGSFASFRVAKLHFASTVISQYRKEWNSRLLESLSEFQSIIFRINSVLSGTDRLTSESETRKYLEKGVLVSNKILFMLDPSDSDQNSLQALIVEISRQIADVPNYNPTQVADLMDAIINSARKVFAAQWEKAQKGV